MVSRNLLFPLLGVSLMLAGCGGSTSSELSTQSFKGVSYGATIYSYDFTANSFTYKQNTESTANTGTVVSYASGFKRLNYTDRTPIKTYGVFIPGKLAFVCATNLATKLVALGSYSPSVTLSSFTTNYIVMTSDNSFDPATSVAASVVSTTVVANSLNRLFSDYRMGNDTPSVSSAMLPCVTSGDGEFASGDSYAIGVSRDLTSWDVDFTQSTTRFGLPAPTSDVVLSDLLTREFRGFIYKPGSYPVAYWGRNDGSGSLSWGTYTDGEEGVESNTENAKSMTTTIDSQPSPGVLNVTMTPTSGDPIHAILAVAKIDTRYAIFGIGKDTSGAHLYQFCFVEK